MSSNGVKCCSDLEKMTKERIKALDLKRHDDALVTEATKAKEDLVKRAETAQKKIQAVRMARCNVPAETSFDEFRAGKVPSENISKALHECIGEIDRFMSSKEEAEDNRIAIRDTMLSREGASTLSVAMPSNGSSAGSSANHSRDIFQQDPSLCFMMGRQLGFEKGVNTQLKELNKRLEIKNDMAGPQAPNHRTRTPPSRAQSDRHLYPGLRGKQQPLPPTCAPIRR